MERDTLEHQLFTWEGWDEMQVGDLQFHDVTLTVQVGEHPAGTKFPAAFLVGSQSMLILMNEQDEEFAYDLKLSVGEKLAKPEPHEHEDACGCGHEH
jgi:hypothetical protein